jgi:hypothetical protein
MFPPVPSKTPLAVRFTGHAQAVRATHDAFPIILIDCSGSMDLPVGGRRRIDILADILRQVLPTTPGARLVAFNNTVSPIASADQLPEPDGGTDLRRALEQIAPWRPRRVIVVSDGEPDDRVAALRAARALYCPIDAFHAGPEDDRAAIAFLRNLCLCGRGVGRATVADLCNPGKLAGELRLLLTGPRRG